MIKPLPGYCLIQPIEDEGKSAGGLYLPDSSKDKPQKGKVIVCGDYTKEYGKKKLCPVTVGQTCIYKKWTNQEVTHEGKEYLLVAFSELLAVIE